jgi:pimeloyl-ACP methyl ester carboxylesterase
MLAIPVMTRLGFVALAIAGIAGAYLGVLFLVQRSLLYPAPPRSSDRDVRGAEIVRIGSPAGDVPALLLAPETRTPVPLVMFTHGNAELATDWLPVFDEIAHWGAAVMLVEFPGYGGAPGAPSESSILDVVRAAYDWAAADPRIDAKRIVAYGRSLGGGAAARLAADRPVAALILESSFTSVADFAARLLAPGFLVRDRFDNRAALAKYRGPLLVIHGTHDTLVPIAQGRELSTLVPDARFHEIDCGHNDCSREWRTIRSFLTDAGVLPALSEGQ